MKNVNKIKIEKNIPLPRKRAVYKNNAELMEIGDSLLVKDKIEADSLKNSLRYLKRKFMQRKEKDGIRIWRSE